MPGALAPPTTGLGLAARDVVHSFPPRKGHPAYLALDSVSLDVGPGRFVSIVGPSGCGKTTLLRILAGLTRPSQGQVFVGGQEIREPHERVSMVFQDFRLLPWDTVLSNVEFPLELQHVAADHRHARSGRLIEMIGLERFTHFYPQQLSGGMRQRVGLARALMTDPAILLMDEPFGALDAQTRELMQVELLKLWDSLRMTVVFVTHGVDEAVLLSDEILVMSRGPGTVKARLEVDLPRPRWTDEVRNSTDFARYRSEVWRLLRPEVAVE